MIKTITKEALSSFKISYPKIEEQHRIAKIIFDMNEDIFALEQNLSKYKMLMQGMMQELLTGKTRLV
ncbi:MAG: restriction endonuclease subunit S [Bacteroidetes bacterium]|nr:restriction endonuclease subunit S [Bacteroidota bacterium]